MKLKKFLRKYPECSEYTIKLWYAYCGGKDQDERRDYDCALQDLHVWTHGVVGRVVGVDHKNKKVYVVKGNV